MAGEPDLTEKDFKIDRSRRLGDGSYAQVFVGKRLDNNEEVAVKVMDLKVCSKSNFINIALEIEIMNQLNHPNIVNMQASWSTASETLLVLDFCGGGELFKYMKKYDLSHMPVVAPQFVGEIVLALDYLRNKGVIHRDMKPENILLTSAFHVKVADFGTACWAEGEEDAKKFTGTAQYMAPEVLQGTKTAV
ncbi:Serine/threonine-protein kinase ATG1a [Diplonema papillatum]|nr:Serine/threonine-protein kinase ATG1a [Diplonema papillatum]